MGILVKQQPEKRLTPEGSKATFLDEVMDVLRKLLDYCLCCVTCGCYPGMNRDLHGDAFCDTELTEDESTAVQNLLAYLDSGDAKDPTINEERLRALCILTYSDNEELQRSAALCFAELSQRMRSPVTEIMLEPLVVLLRSRDAQVQKAASLAISNYALNGADSNKTAILNSGALKPLLQLLHSNNVEVQCNTCGCITTLATTDKTKHEVVTSGGVRPLLRLATSEDLRVQRNATGALLNLTHLQGNRNELVHQGALAVLVDVLHSADPDVQYYCAAALSNMAVLEKHRTMMVALGHYDAIRQLIKLLKLTCKEKVRCQSCLALRNLASDSDNQVLIVKLGCLPLLHTVIKRYRGETLAAAVACLRNLSIHKANEHSIIQETFLLELCRVLQDHANPQAQMHAAGTMRNLAAGDHIKKIIQGGCVEALVDAVMTSDTKDVVLSEVTAAMAVLADEEEAREKILSLYDGKVFERLVAMATGSGNPEICYNCAGAVGQLSLVDLSEELLQINTDGLMAYLDKFLSSGDPSNVHIALWTLTQLLRFESFISVFKQSDLVQLVRRAEKSDHSLAISELAQSAMKSLEG